MRTDDLHAELEAMRDEIEPFTPNALEVHRRVRRRRVILRSTAAAVALVVATGVAVSVRDAGKKRVEVTSTKIEENLAAFGRVDYLVFPQDVSATQRLLDDSAVVTKYALLHAGPRAPTENGLLLGGFVPAACRLRDELGIAVQIDDDNPAATRPGVWFGDASRIEDVSPYAHVDAEIYMAVGASPAQIQAVMTALAADDELASPPQFIDHATAYKQFSEEFADQPELVDGATAEDLPESFRLHLKDERGAERLLARYNLLPGVDIGIDKHANRGLSALQSDVFGRLAGQPGADRPDAEVFMRIDATAGDVDAVADRLAQRDDVKDFRYLSRDDALAQFKRDFADQPDLIDSTTAADLPESFRVTATDEDRIDAIEGEFSSMPGVDTVITALSPIADDVCK